MTGADSTISRLTLTEGSDVRVPGIAKVYCEIRDERDNILMNIHKDSNGEIAVGFYREVANREMQLHALLGALQESASIVERLSD